MPTSSKAEPSSGWPRVGDGDVLVVVSSEHIYQLDSSTLRTNSTQFERQLKQENAVSLCSKARREGITIRFRLELELPKVGTDSCDYGKLALRRLDDFGRPRKSSAPFRTPFGVSPSRLFQHYDNLLRAIYHEPLNFDSDQIGVQLGEIVQLVGLAEHLGAVKVITLAVNSTLLNQGQILWRSVAANAVAWADLAYRIQSEHIFKEAIIHIVGQWNRLHSTTAVRALRPEISNLIDRKATELDEIKQVVETRLGGHCPDEMRRGNPHDGSTSDANVGPGSVTQRGHGQSTHAKLLKDGIFYWMAVAFFRQWLTQHACADLSRRSPDGGFAFYSAISRGAAAYLDHAAVERFVLQFPVSSKSRTAFDAALARLKQDLRPYVAQLVAVNCQLDVKTYPVDYLTCCRVGKDDLPWRQPLLLSASYAEASDHSDDEGGGPPVAADDDDPE